MNPVKSAYMLGHTPHEQRRLDEQGLLFRAASERMLRAAGIGAGQRVLDVGCGTGSLSCLAGEVVCPSGCVVGIDRSADVLNTARAHAERLRLAHVRFLEGDLQTFATDELFDAVIGRFVLVHVPNPVETVRRLSKLVRPGGAVAFAESVCLPHVLAAPRPPLLDRLLSWGTATLTKAGVATDFGLRLWDVLLEAGLPEPDVRLEPLTAVGDDPLLVDYAVDMVRTLAPLIERFGIATAAEVGIDTLEARLHEDLAGTGLHCAVLLGAAWSRVPAGN